jgi:hypothetical protein
MERLRSSCVLHLGEWAYEVSGLLGVLRDRMRPGVLKRFSSSKLFDKITKEMIYETNLQDATCRSGFRFDGGLLDLDGHHPVWHSDGGAS